MFYRVRTRLTDAPGSLATLAQRCGEAGVNILALQIYPDLGSVTDDLIVEVPENWTAAAVVDLVSGAGGDEVSVSPCAAHDLQDQPTQWLAAARVVMEEPDQLPGQLTRLLGPRVSLSATEQVRAAALTDIAEAAAAADSELRPPKPSVDAVIEYDTTDTGVVARVGSSVVGAASFVPGEPAEGSLEVAPAWRRMGIGRQLLRRLCAVAGESGINELVLLAPASEDGVVPLLSAAGMRGRIRLTEQGLSVHLVVSRSGERTMGRPAAASASSPV